MRAFNPAPFITIASVTEITGLKYAEPFSTLYTDFQQSEKTDLSRIQRSNTIIYILCAEVEKNTMETLQCQQSITQQNIKNKPGCDWLSGI